MSLIDKILRVEGGTPRTMGQAIIHAIDAEGADLHVLIKIALAQMVYLHVKDYLAQRFSASMLENAGTTTEKEIEKLWLSILG